MGWTRIRIQDGPVLPGLFSRTSRKKTKNWELFSMGNLSVLEGQLACVRVCVPACGCESVHTCEWRGGVGRRLGPHPSAAPLPAASLSRLLWQMFGCAMATPEQDVPLDCNRDKPTLTGRPHRSPPQRPVAENHLGPGRGQIVFVSGDRQSWHPPRGQWQGRRRRTHVHSPAESLLQ